MILLFVIMLPLYISIPTLIGIQLFFFLSYKKNLFFVGSDFYTALLYSFLLPGLGLLYLNSAKKAFIWHFAQYIFVIFTLILSFYTNYEYKYYGLIISIPFLVQLFMTCIEYKNEYGDIDKIF